MIKHFEENYCNFRKIIGRDGIRLVLFIQVVREGLLEEVTCKQRSNEVGHMNTEKSFQAEEVSDLGRSLVHALVRGD